MNNSLLCPYLFFNGQCADAMKFYESVFGGKLDIQTYEQAQMGSDPAVKDRIIHAQLVADGLSFMASDSQLEQPVVVGSNVHMSLVGSDEAKLTGYFNALGAGGTVDMPLAKQFWGDVYGMLTDKFGIRWMVNISAGTPANA